MNRINISCDTGNTAAVEHTTYTTAIIYSCEPIITQTGSSTASILWYSTAKQPSTGWNLYYYGQRFYSSGMHTWLSREPNIAKRDAHEYGFVLNRPSSIVDTDGRGSGPPFGGGGGHSGPAPGNPPPANPGSSIDPNCQYVWQAGNEWPVSDLYFVNCKCDGTMPCKDFQSFEGSALKRLNNSCLQVLSVGRRVLSHNSE